MDGDRGFSRTEVAALEARLNRLEHKTFGNGTEGLEDRHKGLEALMYGDKRTGRAGRATVVLGLARQGALVGRTSATVVMCAVLAGVGSVASEQRRSSSVVRPPIGYRDRTGVKALCTALLVPGAGFERALHVSGRGVEVREGRAGRCSRVPGSAVELRILVRRVSSNDVECKCVRLIP